MPTTRLKDWLEISTEGFAQRQADRKPEHLLKELVQNALDAVNDDAGGTIKIKIEPAVLNRKKVTLVSVADNGAGISDPSDLRTVFCTSKTDSFLLRGRLGQGFKEMLCLAREAKITSKDTEIHFHVEKGERVTDIKPSKSYYPGTVAVMWMDWPLDSHPSIIKYLHSLIPPLNVTITVNDQAVTERQVEEEIMCDLKTELFLDGRWVRRERQGLVQLVKPAFPGEAPMIYEMGIPVQEIDWTQDYHINVQMRVPMNPRRDAVAAGYLKDIYRQVLPMLMPKIEAQDLRDEWVSQAIEDADSELRKEVVTAAFGNDAVRSVPTLGRHDFDSDAREIGYTPIDTRLLPRGLRMATQEVLPTSRDVEMQRRETVSIARAEVLYEPDDEPLLAFVNWLAGELVGKKVHTAITKELVIHGVECVAAWGAGCSLTLNNRLRSQWEDPLSERFLGILVHEVAHENAGHHGDEFRREVERMSGKLARLCLLRGEEITERWTP